MRPIHLAKLDKTRPALILTRSGIRSRLNYVTIAPITSRIRGISTEVHLGITNGLESESVATLDNIVTISTSLLGRQIGFLRDNQEIDLLDAIRFAFDLV